MFSEAGTTDLRNIFQIDGEGCQVQNSLALDMTATIDFIQDDVCTCKLLAFDLETRPTHGYGLLRTAQGQGFERCCSCSVGVLLCVLAVWSSTTAVVARSIEKCDVRHISRA